MGVATVRPSLDAAPEGTTPRLHPGRPVRGSTASPDVRPPPPEGSGRLRPGSAALPWKATGTRVAWLCRWQARLRTLLTISLSSLPLPRTSTNLHPRALAGFHPFPRPFAESDCRLRLRPGFACGLGPAADVLDDLSQFPAASVDFRQPSPEGVGRFPPVSTTVRWVRLPFCLLPGVTRWTLPDCGRSRQPRPGPDRFRELPPTFTRGRWPVSTRFHDRSQASIAIPACGLTSPDGRCQIAGVPDRLDLIPTASANFHRPSPEGVGRFRPVSTTVFRLRLPFPPAAWLRPVDATGLRTFPTTST
jgi:hypothetical protein